MIQKGLTINKGQQVTTESIPVTIASNQPDINVSQPTASNLNAQVVGNVANAATDSGNPVKAGGVFNTSIPLLTNGQRGNLQLGENSALIVSSSNIHHTAQQRSFSSTTIDTLQIGTSETSIYLFRNANGNTNKARIFKCFLNLGGSCLYKFYHTPTITSTGTSLARINQKIMTSPATAQITTFQSPTASANGTLLFQYQVSAQGSTTELNLPHDLILNPNFDLLITGKAGSNNTPVSITIFWYEVPA